MSALAYIVAQRHLPVSGSDLKTSHLTSRLESLGTKIFHQQQASNLNCFTIPQALNQDALISPLVNSNAESETTSILTPITSETLAVLPQVICSTAISSSNPEYQAAKDLGCPIFHRSDLLAALIAEYDSIAVSGTHGKTTTSSAIAYMLLQAGLDPTIIVGGEVDAWQGNARSGTSNYLVAEADESDGSLVKHTPKIGIITNIELDHPDRYDDITEVIAIFQTFAQQCQTVIGCLDDGVIQDNITLDISYSLNPAMGADYTVTDVVYQAQGTQAQVWEGSKCLGTLNWQLLGKHNLSNALAAIAVGRKIGLEFAVIAQGLASFSGTKRRFELRGEVNNIRLIDDYAHHPSEVAVTLAAARLRVTDNSDEKRVIAVFQPHRYSRVEAFISEFATAFTDADLVVVTDIYSAGEANPKGISGQQMADAIAQSHSQIFYHQNLATLPNFLQQEILQPGDLVIFLGAGNLNQAIPQTLDLLKSN
ncbi:MAG TPA: UDP-N-acetylmuramate--L-alanine ligase [Xenococcaceae cyanobacterium]